MYVKKAITVSKSIQEESNKEEALKEIAILFAQAGKFEKALELAESIEDVSASTTAIAKIALEYSKIDTKDSADELFSLVINKIRSLDDVKEKSWLLHKIATIYLAAGLYKDSMDLSIESIEIDRELKTPTKQIDKSLRNLSEKFAIESQFTEALRLTEQIVDKGQKYKALGKIVLRYIDEKQFDQAFTIFNTFDAGNKDVFYFTIALKKANAGLFSDAMKTSTLIKGKFYKVYAIALIAEKSADHDFNLSQEEKDILRDIVQTYQPIDAFWESIDRGSVNARTVASTALSPNAPENNSLVENVFNGIKSLSNNNELTRDEAKIILNNSDKFASQYDTVKFHDNGYKKIVKHGLTSRSYDLLGAGIKAVGRQELSLVRPYSLNLEKITGIADVPLGDGKIKIVEFTWERSGLPKIARRYVYNGSTGKAQFRLYDDGWRIESINLNQADTLFELSAKELETEKMDSAAEKERIRRVNEARRRAQVEYASKVREAKTSSKVIGTYEYTDFKYRKSVLGTLTLTDVGVNFSLPPIRRSNINKTDSQTMYFFDAFKPSRSDYIHDVKTRSIQYRYAWIKLKANWGNISIKTSQYTNATWGWKAHIVLFSPIFSKEYETPLRFLDESERDRFVKDLKKSLQSWYRENQSLVKRPSSLSDLRRAAG